MQLHLLFPVCDGGCPYLTMKGKLFEEYHDRCHAAKGNLDEFLDMHIDMKERINLSIEVEDE